MSKDYDLILIDGHSLVYRAFFALPPLSAADGRPTNAAYGFMRMLLRLLADRRPQALVVSFDKGLPVHRLEKFADYKAHRPEMPDELRGQFPLVHEVLEALGVCVCECEGFEADDVIGTLSRQAEDLDLRTLIVTGDRDLLQLVSKRTHGCLTRKGITTIELYDPAAVMEQWGVTPELLLDVKALMGDSSDNIPGIPGIGEKTALKLVQAYGRLDDVIRRAGEIKGRAGRLVEEFSEQARLSRELAVIDRSAPVELDMGEAKLEFPDRQDVEPLFAGLGFRSLLPQLPARQQTEQVGLFADTGRQVCRLVGDGASELTEKIGDTGRLAVVFEPAVVGVGAVLGLAVDDEQGFWWSDDIDHIVSLLALVVPGWLDGNGDVQLIGHGSKSLITELIRRGKRPGPVTFDSELAWYLLDPIRSAYPLSDLAQVYGGEMLPEVVTKRKRSQPVPTAESVGEVLAKGAAVLHKLQSGMMDDLRQRELDQLLMEVELPLVSVLSRMEARGIAVDRERLAVLDREFGKRLGEVEQEIYGAAGTEFNINSPRQVAELLFDKLGLPAGRKTKTGYSTDAEVLEVLAVDHEVPRLILEHRQLAKLKSTYVDALGAQVDERTGRVHTRFNQAVTATGRLSSSDPNLQNIPIRMEIGRRIREVFVPGERELVLMAADYSQIELRVLAHLSGDQGLIASFQNDEDIHTRTAAEVFGVGLEQVTGEMRSRAKAVNFGIVYGITEWGLAKDLGVEQQEAREYINGYFDRYPAVREFMDGQVEHARREGFVGTVLGRIRCLPEINSRNVAARRFAERTAFNTPVQGSAADIIKLAMLKVTQRLEDAGVPAWLLLQVHDELVWEVERSAVDEVAMMVKEEMEGAYPLLVPLRVDVKAGEDWGHMVVVD